MKFYPNNPDMELSNFTDENIEKIKRNDPRIRFLNLSSLPFILNRYQATIDLFKNLIKKNLYLPGNKKGIILNFLILNGCRSELFLINALKNNKYIRAITFWNDHRSYKAIPALAEIIFYNSSVRSPAIPG